MKKTKMQNGFSFLELLVYIAILSIVTMVVSGIFISLSKGGSQVEARAEVNSALRFILERISQDLRMATSSAGIISPVSTAVASSTLSFSVGADVISYATTTDNELQRSVNSASEIITLDKVVIDSLNFVRLENYNQFFSKTFASIQVEIVARYNSESPDWQYSEKKKTTISLR